MKKLLVATAALTLVLATVPNVVSRSQAAPMGDVPTKSEYCNMAKSQRNPVAWNAFYNCLDKRAAAPATERKRERHAGTPKSPYCSMAKSQRNPVSWNAHYNCLEQQASAAPAVGRNVASNVASNIASKREAHAKDPYCDMAKSQRNPVSWNERYNCLSNR